MSKSEAEALQNSGRHAEAIVALRRVLAETPADVEAWTRLGWILNLTGQVDESITAHRRAIDIHPAFASAWANLGVALQAKGDHDGALEALLHAVSLNPELPESQVNLGLEWQARGLISEAIACCRRAISLRPQMAEAWINLANALQSIGEVGLAVAALDHTLRLQPGNMQALSNLLMTCHYEHGSHPHALRVRAESLSHRLAALTQPWLSRLPRDDRRLRVGYVSGDFYAHPVGWMLKRVLCAHDRHTVEVHCFADVFTDDAVTSEIRDGVERWHDTRPLSDSALLDLIRGLHIDVLVDLAGHTAHNRLAVFASRAAPVQLSWLGYAATTGVHNVDGIILCEAMAPVGTEEGFTEKIYRIPRCHFSYSPPDYAPDVADCPEKSTGIVTFGSFNNVAKMGSEVLSLWAKVLLAVPHSRLILKWRTLADPLFSQQIHSVFAGLGISKERIVLRPASTHPAMLAEYGDIDIALDPFPFCGGLTTCEALWMGVPVVTLPWLRPMSRQGLVLLKALGLDEWVASTPRHYVEIARQLAEDLSRRSTLRHSLRQRIAASALFDGLGLAASLEEQYQLAMSTKFTQ